MHISPRTISQAISVLATVLVVTTGCANSEPDDLISPADLQPADQVIGGRIDQYQLGDTAEFGNGLTISLDAPTVSGDDMGPWIEIVSRIENRNPTIDAQYPNVAIVCSGSTEEGGYQIGSTVLFGDPVPAGSFLDSRLHLLLPGDGRYGEPIPTCTTPAVVRVSLLTYEDGDTPVVDFVLPDAVVDEVNGRR